MSSSGIGPDGKVYCKHMEEAAKRKSNNPKHPNREFYCCKRSQSDQTKCDFWYWADQLPRSKDSTVHASNPSATSPATPRSVKEGGAKPRPTPIPRSRSPQKHLSPSDTPRSKKRLEDIEAGLRQRKHDLSPTRHAGPPKESEPSPPHSGVEAIPQPPSPVPTEVDCEVEAQPRKTFSFLGLDYSPEPITSTIKDEDRPSTPKKRRVTPPIEGEATQSTADAAPCGGLPLTPPQTTRHVAQPEEAESASPIMRGRKGKEREVVAPVRTQDQDYYSGEAREEHSLPLFTLPEDISSASSASPTTAENVLDYTDGMKTRVKALSDYMDSFDIAQAAKLLQTTERQKVRHECRDRSQKMRIEELVAEQDRLVAEVSRLKEALRRAEEGNRVKDVEIASLKGR